MKLYNIFIKNSYLSRMRGITRYCCDV